MKILITGGLGHIGSYIVENINKMRNVNKVYIIDNLSTERYCSLFNLPKNKKKIYFYQKDLSVKDSLKKFKNCVAKISIIIKYLKPYIYITDLKVETIHTTIYNSKYIYECFLVFL